MGFVPFGLQYATLDVKHKIRKMLEYLGITHPAHQVEFMSALLDKPFDTTKMSRQDFYTLVTKIQNIQENRNKARNKNNRMLYGHHLLKSRFRSYQLAECNWITLDTLW